MSSALKLSGAQPGRLLSEEEAIEHLGLHARPNPRGALRWLMRVRKLSYVRLAKGIYAFRLADLEAFIASNRVAAGGQKKSRKSRPDD